MLQLKLWARGVQPAELPWLAVVAMERNKLAIRIRVTGAKPLNFETGVGKLARQVRAILRGYA